jgi:hypothetical protein
MAAPARPCPRPPRPRPRSHTPGLAEAVVEEEVARVARQGRRLPRTRRSLPRGRTSFWSAYHPAHGDGISRSPNRYMSVVRCRSTCRTVALRRLTSMFARVQRVLDTNVTREDQVTRTVQGVSVTRAPAQIGSYGARSDAVRGRHDRGRQPSTLSRTRCLDVPARCRSRVRNGRRAAVRTLAK